MSWLDELFEIFDERIGLDKTRLSRVRSAYSSLEKFIRDDGPLSEVFVDLYPQGSVALNTAIKPQKDGQEFDADAVFVLDITKRPADKRSPQEVIAWVASRLRNRPQFEGTVRERARCVRIDYAGDFHLDVVPGYLAGLSGVIFVPDKAMGWRRSNPKAYVAW